MEDVLFERKDQVEIITLNRPQALNCFNNEILYALTRRFAELHQDDDCRAVVITGAGRGFCTGADLTGGGLAPMPPPRWVCASPPTSIPPSSVA